MSQRMTKVRTQLGIKCETSIQEVGGGVLRVFEVDIEPFHSHS